MARGEHDRPDPSLIVEGSQRPLSLKRVQGHDYPIPVSEELYTNQKEGVAYKVAPRPDGDAVREDGTLKDTSEIEWKRQHQDQDTSGPAESDGKRPKHPKSRKQGITGTGLDSDDSDASIDIVRKAKGSTSYKRRKETVSCDGESDGMDELSSNACDINKKDPTQLKDPTKDLRLCGRPGTGMHPTRKNHVNGWYCKFCLELGRPKTSAFLVGNVTLRQRHLQCCHPDDYWIACINSSFTPDPLKFPRGWIPPSSTKSNTK
ncbi:hypothetical protein BGW80DRAFT_1250163 [Lactifluus volemus]|nr:hypothetical protein BGW80DRAFT_1250163 [Lactifluus volemus]